MDLIADGQLHHEHPLKAFLFYRFVRPNAPEVVGDIPGQFFLTHVDENFKVTDIIDGHFARAAPAAEAFGPSYFTTDMASLYFSHICVTENDRVLANAPRNRGGDPCNLG